MSRSILVYFSFHGCTETGWVREDSGVFVVQNIPLADSLAIDDEVELSPDSIPTILRVVKRKWPLKSEMRYPRDAKYATISNAIRGSGLGWTEGYLRGLAAVCHTEDLTQNRLNELLESTGGRAFLTGTHKPALRGA